MSNSQNKLGQREAEVSQCASVEPRGIDWTLLANVAHPQTFKCLTFYRLFNLFLNAETSLRVEGFREIVCIYHGSEDACICGWNNETRTI